MEIDDNFQLGTECRGAQTLEWLFIRLVGEALLKV